jgi:hypothetical protein
MQQNPSSPPQPPPPPHPFFTPNPKDSKTTLYIILATSLFSLFFFLSSSFSSSSTSASQIRPDPYLFPTRQTSSDPPPPSIAYLISGSAGDSGRILRLLLATYHPRNQYLLHLDLSAPQTERDDLALAVQSIPIFKAAQNVNVVGKADFAYPKGSSAISFTLRGASILLRLSPNWDWFVSLNAADYPLVTQDGTVCSAIALFGFLECFLFIFLYGFLFLLGFRSSSHFLISAQRSKLCKAFKLHWLERVCFFVTSRICVTFFFFG